MDGAATWANYLHILSLFRIAGGMGGRKEHLREAVDVLINELTKSVPSARCEPGSGFEMGEWDPAHLTRTLFKLELCGRRFCRMARRLSIVPFWKVWLCERMGSVGTPHPKKADEGLDADQKDGS